MRGLPVRLLTHFHAMRLKDGLKRSIASYFLRGPSRPSS